MIENVEKIETLFELPWASFLFSVLSWASVLFSFFLLADLLLKCLSSSTPSHVASLDSSRSKKDLVYVCQLASSSLAGSRDLLSRPQFFDFVARAVRTVCDDQSDSKLAGAVKLLLGTLTVIIIQRPLARRERKAKHSALALLEELLEGAKRGFINNEVVSVIGNMATWLNTSGDRSQTIKLCHLLLELHAIKSIRTLRDEPGRPRIELSTGSTNVIGSFLSMLNLTLKLNSEDPEGARREGLAPTPALLGSVLRHMATLAKESRDGRWSENHAAVMAALGRSFTAFGLLAWPSGPPESALEQLDLPADSRADVALALGLYLAQENRENASLMISSPMIRLVTSPVLEPHILFFLGAPGCLAKLVDLAEGQMEVPMTLLTAALLNLAMAWGPSSAAPLFKTPDFARFVEVSFRQDVLKVLSGNVLMHLLEMSICISFEGESGPNPQHDRAIDIVLSKVGSACPSTAPLIPVPMPDLACSGGRGRTSSWFSSRLPWMTLGLPIASGCCSSCSRWTSI